MTEGDTLTINEAAALKGVSREAIRKAIREGRIPAHVVHITPARAMYRIKKEDLDAYVPATPEEKGRRGGNIGGRLGGRPRTRPASPDEQNPA